MFTMGGMGLDSSGSGKQFIFNHDIPLQKMSLLHPPPPTTTWAEGLAAMRELPGKWYQTRRRDIAKPNRSAVKIQCTPRGIFREIREGGGEIHAAFNCNFQSPYFSGNADTTIICTSCCPVASTAKEDNAILRLTSNITSISDDACLSVKPSCSPGAAHVG